MCLEIAIQQSKTIAIVPDELFRNIKLLYQANYFFIFFNSSSMRGTSTQQEMAKNSVSERNGGDCKLFWQSANTRGIFVNHIVGGRSQGGVENADGIDTLFKIWSDTLFKILNDTLGELTHQERF